MRWYTLSVSSSEYLICRGMMSSTSIPYEGVIFLTMSSMSDDSLRRPFSIFSNCTCVSVSCVSDADPSASPVWKVSAFMEPTMRSEFRTASRR